MEPISFIVTSLAGAALKKIADDVYGKLKAKIVALVGSAGVGAVEADPANEHARKFLESQIAASKPALSDSELPRLAAAVAAELARLSEGEVLAGGVTVRDIVAARTILLKDIEAHGGALISISGIRGQSIHLENIRAGDDGKLEA